MCLHSMYKSKNKKNFILFHLKIIIFAVVKIVVHVHCILHRRVNAMQFETCFFSLDITLDRWPLGNFFYFLVFRMLRPKFLHFRKKKKIFLTFFIFSDVKNCQI